MNSTTKIAILLLITGIIVALIYWYYSKNKTIPYRGSIPTEQPSDEIPAGSIQEATEETASKSETSLIYTNLKAQSPWKTGKDLTVYVDCYNPSTRKVETDIYLMANDKKYKTSVSIGAGRKITSSFIVKFKTSGIYTLKISDCSIQVTVTLSGSENVWDGSSYEKYSKNSMESDINGVKTKIYFNSSICTYARTGHSFLSDINNATYPAGTSDYNYWTEYVKKYYTINYERYGGIGTFISTSGTKIIIS